MEFRIDSSGAIVRTVSIPGNPIPYVHRCEAETFRTVADAVETVPQIKLELIAENLDLPYTQVNVALEFMKDRGCLGTEGRKTFLVSKFTYEDCLTEYYALRNIANYL